MKALALIAASVLTLCHAQIKLGKILVDAEARSLTFPAKVNQTEGIIEFLLVHKNGKVHEALFSTEIPAIELNAALNLLGLETDKENKAAIPKVTALAAAPSLQVLIANQDKAAWQPATSYIRYNGSLDPPALHPWHYSGSYFYNDNFMAEVEGDLIAIYTNINALINLEHKDRTDDTVWFAKTRDLGNKNDLVWIKIILKQ